MRRETFTHSVANLFRKRCTKFHQQPALSDAKIVQIQYTCIHTYIYVIFIEHSGRERIRSAGWLWTALVVATIWHSVYVLVYVCMQ